MSMGKRFVGAAATMAMMAKIESMLLTYFRGLKMEVKFFLNSRVKFVNNVILEGRKQKRYTRRFTKMEPG